MVKKHQASVIVFWFVGALLGVLALAGCGSTAAASSNAGGNASVMTVSIRENQGASGDVYYFDQTSISLKKGDTITVQNRSDELQDIDQGDAHKAGVDVAIPINQSSTMTFNTSGTFTIKSEKGATITVTVQ